jgi:hypothetical protein
LQQATDEDVLRSSKVPPGAPGVLWNFPGGFAQLLKGTDHRLLHLGFDRGQQVGDLTPSARRDSVDELSTRRRESDAYRSPVLTVRPSPDESPLDQAIAHP